MSAIRNGPKNGSRNPNVLRTTSSRLSRVARPSSTIASASRSSAIWSRLETKPARSATSAGRLPIARRNATTRSTVSRLVAGGGDDLDAGRPLRRVEPVHAEEARRLARPPAASPSIGSEEVLEAMIAVAGAAAEQRPSTSSLSACSSGTASITRSTSPTAASRSGGVVDARGRLGRLGGQQPRVDVARACARAAARAPARRARARRRRARPAARRGRDSRRCRRPSSPRRARPPTRCLPRHSAYPAARGVSPGRGSRSRPPRGARRPPARRSCPRRIRSGGRRRSPCPGRGN